MRDDQAFYTGVDLADDQDKSVITSDFPHGLSRGDILNLDGGEYRITRIVNDFAVEIVPHDPEYRFTRNVVIILLIAFLVGLFFSEWRAL